MKHLLRDDYGAADRKKQEFSVNGPILRVIVARCQPSQGWRSNRQHLAGCEVESIQNQICSRAGYGGICRSISSALKRSRLSLSLRAECCFELRISAINCPSRSSARNHPLVDARNRCDAVEHGILVKRPAVESRNRAVMCGTRYVRRNRETVPEAIL
jgi:hypothetical protein